MSTHPDPNSADPNLADPDLAARQVRKNSQFRDAWERFAPHRQRVTDLICSSGRSGRCCLLGAGNCNDVDLQVLAEAFDEIHLVDIDGQAIVDGVSRQSIQDDSRIAIHGNIDLSSLGGVVSQHAAEPEIDDAIERAATGSAAQLPGPFDVVASVCLLSQLLEIATEKPGVNHPKYLPLVQAIRLGHLRLLCNLVTTGGSGILVTDLVSSESCPVLSTARPEQLPGLVRMLVEQQNFFTGINPAVLHSLFTQDPEIAPQVVDLEMVPPWRWDLGPRSYAVYAVRFKKPS